MSEKHERLRDPGKAGHVRRDTKFRRLRPEYDYPRRGFRGKLARAVPRPVGPPYPAGPPDRGHRTERAIIGVIVMAAQASPGKVLPN